MRALPLALCLSTSFAIAASAEPGAHGYACAVGDGRTLSLASREDEPFPMMSVVKLPLAIVVLHEAEQGRLSLDQSYTYAASQLDAETWSPMLRENPQGGTFTLRELLEWCLETSDNNACDILFGLVGGPERVQGFFRRHYGEDFPLSIVCSEEAFKDRRMMRANCITPRAAVRILQDLRLAADEGKGSLLQRGHARLLLGMMAKSRTARARMKAGENKMSRLHSAALVRRARA